MKKGSGSGRLQPGCCRERDSLRQTTEEMCQEDEHGENSFSRPERGSSAGHEFRELVLGAESVLRDLVREALVERLRRQAAASGPDRSEVEQLDQDGGRVVVGADMDLARDCA